MFSHIVLGYNDLEPTQKFYDAILGAMGAKPAMVDPKNRLIYMHNGNMLMLTRPINGEAASCANGGTVGFAATSPEQADAWHAAGVANGGTTCENPPGVRELGQMKLYLAYLRDPAGNKLCAMYNMNA